MCGPAPARCGCAARGASSGLHTGHVERVHVLACGVMGGNVSAPKLRQFILDVGALGMAKPMAPKIAAISFHGTADRVIRPGWHGPAAAGSRRCARGQPGVQRLVSSNRRLASIASVSASFTGQRSAGGPGVHPAWRAESFSIRSGGRSCRTPTRTAPRRANRRHGQGGVGLGLRLCRSSVMSPTCG